MPTTHPVELLFAALPSVEPYPDGMGRPFGRIGGVGFFPGAAGLFEARSNEPLPRIHAGCLMVVGNDFDSVVGFERSLDAGTESLHSPTWRGMLDLFTRAGVSPSHAFFTNAYMGVRTGPSSVGRSPGSDDPAFRSRCERFFELQVQVMQPSVIVTLGIHVPPFLSALSPQLTSWGRVHSFASLDDVTNGPGPLVDGVVISGADHECSVAALTHPSFRRLNVSTRRFESFSGDRAEVALLQVALTRVPRR